MTRTQALRMAKANRSKHPLIDRLDQAMRRTPYKPVRYMDASKGEGISLFEYATVLRTFPNHQAGS